MWNIDIQLVGYVLVIGLHLFTFIDVLRNLKTEKAPIIVVLAFFPPILGPVIYFLLKSRKSQRHKTFMENKRRFS
ncbi:MAG: hypothetical protein PWR03_106 [Tenuifilum sp.]|jgi:heme/copper-type cytochrome/quinol oxidase subunit 4|uniref:hypothetical protein n=1 Tax=Tenuifilum sp. TaxID=2760880 RepID=UPI0024AA2FC9|nr:hypothetical protein [Tenuifilum sp.]MDI3525923.1 hypothetical protein [Tenuifilum sp.]